MVRAKAKARDMVSASASARVRAKARALNYRCSPRSRFHDPIPKAVN